MYETRESISELAYRFPTIKLKYILKIEFQHTFNVWICQILTTHLHIAGFANKKIVANVAAVFQAGYTGASISMAESAKGLSLCPRKSVKTIFMLFNINLTSVMVLNKSSKLFFPHY